MCNLKHNQYNKLLDNKSTYLLLKYILLAC